MMATITLSVEELAKLIQQQCNAAFDRLNQLDAIHGKMDDRTRKAALLDGALAMHDEGWEVRKAVAEIRKMAQAIERWAADPETDEEGCDND